MTPSFKVFFEKIAMNPLKAIGPAAEKVLAHRASRQAQRGVSKTLAGTLNYDNIRKEFSELQKSFRAPSVRKAADPARRTFSEQAQKQVQKMNPPSLYRRAGIGVSADPSKSISALHPVAPKTRIAPERGPLV